MYVPTAVRCLCIEDLHLGVFFLSMHVHACFVLGTSAVTVNGRMCHGMFFPSETSIHPSGQCVRVSVPGCGFGFPHFALAACIMGGSW